MATPPPNPDRQTHISNLLMNRLRRFAELPLPARTFIVANYLRHECIAAATHGQCSIRGHHHQPFLSNDSTIDAQIFLPIFVLVAAKWEHSAHDATIMSDDIGRALITPDQMRHLQMSVYRTIPQPGALWGISASYAYTMPKQQNNFDIKRRALHCVVKRQDDLF